MEEFDFDQFEVGQRLEYQVDHGKWKIGTLVKIDYNDRSLPWAISISPLREDADEEDLDHEYNEGEWEWRGHRETRPAIYVIDEVPV